MSVTKPHTYAVLTGGAAVVALSVAALASPVVEPAAAVGTVQKPLSPEVQQAIHTQAAADDAALEAAGCRRLTPYSCRHTTATALAVTKNIAPQTVKKVMRWSTARMLDRYAHPDNDAALAAVNTLSKAVE